MSESPSNAPNSSPLPGCIILTTIVVVFGGLAVLYIVVAKVQNRRIAEFSDPEPVERRLHSPEPGEVEQAGRKLDDLESAASGNLMARVSLTAGDLNTLIATRELLADFRGQTFVKAITADGIEAEMSQPVRTGLFGGFRYLNATFVFQPLLDGRTVLFNVVDIRADDDKRPIPEGFVDGYAKLEFFKLDSSNEDLSTVLKKIGRVYLENGQLIVETRTVASP